MTSNKKPLITRSRLLIFLAISIITIGFRLYKIQTPLVEAHSWRQADTLAVARNFVRDGYDLLHPKYDDISKLQSGLDNPNGYRMVELPIFNAIIAIFYQAFSFIPIEQVGRAVNIVFSTISAILIYLILEKTRSKLSAWFATIVFATFPFFVFYTRAVLPETLTITLVLIATYVSLWDSKRFYLKAILAFLMFGIAVLVKPTAIFYGIVPFAIFAQEMPIKRNKIISLVIISAISLLPFLLWRQYIKAYPEGIPSSEWLLTHINTDRGLEVIFFKPAFFRWIFYERLNIIILGSFSFLLPVIGLLSQTKKHIHYLFSFASLAYLFTFQGGNVQHEYYQILILPTIAMLLGLGVDHIVKSQKNVYIGVFANILIIGILISSWIFSYDKVRHYYYSLSDIPQFAKVVKDLTDPNDKIVVDTQGDTTTLFAFDRKGSPAIIGIPPELKDMGYSYLFTYNQETADNLIRDFDLDVVFRNNRFVLIKL